MTRFSRVRAVAVALLIAVPLLAGAQQTASERAHFEHYTAYAGAPVEQVPYFRIDGFEYLAPDTLAIWFGVNKMYLLTVQTPCLDLAFANAIGLTSSHILNARFDSVEVRHQQCRILKIRPVDELRMKRDAAKVSTSAPAASG